ncbi:hypothetical protein Q1695_000070 [Nippostrongylus brasiliensis]|nr:hypothetical protein Q1695_000070 [Nippostrongylus brasiliensis]
MGFDSPRGRGGGEYDSTFLFAANQVANQKHSAEKTEAKPKLARQGVKREAESDDRDVKHIKIELDESVIVEEENKRRKERDERSLFIRGFPKNTKAKELEELSEDIETVRHRRGSSFAWIVFRNEASCTKAHGTLTKAMLGGKPLSVDFCGSRAKGSKARKENMPLDPLRLFINGVPRNVTKDDIKNVFRAAVSISISNARNDLGKAFVKFSTEEDAKAAFDKGKGLKLSGRSVEVFYARKPRQILASASAKAAKPEPSNRKAKAAASKKPVVGKKVGDSDGDEGSDRDEEMASSYENIEDSVEQPKKKTARCYVYVHCDCGVFYGVLREAARSVRF